MMSLSPRGADGEILPRSRRSCSSAVIFSHEKPALIKDRIGAIHPYPKISFDLSPSNDKRPPQSLQPYPLIDPLANKKVREISQQVSILSFGRSLPDIALG